MPRVSLLSESGVPQLILAGIHFTAKITASAPARIRGPPHNMNRACVTLSST
jgi:hypothetical protein